jgi:lysophosphatidic acid acyltransferase/lysophosphatidylinositol acyltransferase
MRGKPAAIYDIQIAFKPSDPVKPTMKNLLLGKPLKGHMYAKRIPIEEVPEGDEAAAEWLHKLYQQKVVYQVYVIYSEGKNTLFIFSDR